MSRSQSPAYFCSSFSSYFCHPDAVLVRGGNLLVLQVPWVYFMNPRRVDFACCSFQQDCTSLAEKCLLVALVEVMSSYV